MQLSFHSLLASAQEVDFFTDVLLDTGLSGDLEPDTSLVTELESIPQAALLEEELAATEEWFELELAIELEQMWVHPEFEIHSACELRNMAQYLAQAVVYNLDS
jgi:hypothetical protein